MQFLANSGRSFVSCAADVRACRVGKSGVCLAVALLFASFTAHAQSGATPAQPAPAAIAPATGVPQVTPGTDAQPSISGEITEEELRRQLVGKQLFLRGGYLGDSLTFNEYGDPVSSPLKSSFTLSGIEIEKVKLSKHKAEFEGARYALHFVGDSPYDDPSKEMDRVKITPKKKIVKITIDREQVSRQKEPKSRGKTKKAGPAPPQADDSAAAQVAEQQEAAADPRSVTTTTSPAHAAQLLRAAIDKVFAQGIDEKLRAQMPQFWQLYFESRAATARRPKDPSVLPANAVDQQARVLTSIAPQSNQYAQANGVAGRALYRAVIGADGKPSEISVLRPIGFGLDENAVEAIRKASFQPAMKAGQPVAEALDLSVLFRIYSNKTAITEDGKLAGSPADPSTPGGTEIKPGPYSVGQPAAKPQ